MKKSRMKPLPLVFCTAVTLAGASYGQIKPTEVPISLEELNRRSVVGSLGLPLGTAVAIEAEVVSGRSLRSKEFESLYLLKVTHADGKELNTPPLMQFSTPEFAHVELTTDTFALYEMKHGEKAERLTSSQITELERGYVGKKLRLTVYEIGTFHGIPNDLPKDVPSWADSAFHFSTSLTVLNERVSHSKSGETRR